MIFVFGKILLNIFSHASRNKTLFKKRYFKIAIVKHNKFSSLRFRDLFAEYT